MLAGEPGIGKSRLAEELAEHARGRGAKVLTGRCWEAGGAPVYWPWVQALRAHVRETDDDALRAQLGAGAAELAQIVPELRQRFPDLARLSSVEWEGGRVRLFDAAAELLRAAARQRPIVLMLDDMSEAARGAFPRADHASPLARRAKRAGGRPVPRADGFGRLVPGARGDAVREDRGEPLVHRRDRAAARRRSRSLDLARRAATRDSTERPRRHRPPAHLPDGGMQPGDASRVGAWGRVRRGRARTHGRLLGTRAARCARRGEPPRASSRGSPGRPGASASSTR
jgi:hypothetical protein